MDDRLRILGESRIPGDRYVRFGGEHTETYYSNIARRRVFSLQKRTIVKSEKISTSFISGVIKQESTDNVPFIEIEKPGGVIIRLFKQMPAEFIKSLC